MDWKQKGHTAVITGGASGIGLAVAGRLAGAGMNLVIADRDSEALKKAQAALQPLCVENAAVLPVACDVSDKAQVEKLRDAAFERFGAVHCLMNNAGMVLPAATPWADGEALEKILAVNLWGVIHGCQAFIPKMLAGGAPGVIIHTGSRQGITRPPGNFAYNLSKAGVLAYTESVSHALTMTENCKLTAHLLVPGLVYSAMIARFLPQKPPGAWTPQQTADFMLQRLAEGDFYILCPDHDTPRTLDEKRIQWSADDLIKNRPALSRWHPDYRQAFADYIQRG